MMQIAGIQKMTLVDYPGKIAATVFLRGCNFRCGFCHNPELVLPEQFLPLLSKEELFTFLESRLGKLQGVCITGGEPLLWGTTRQLVSHIKALGYAVKLDTNGSYPERLEAIIKDGDLDYVAMDIKAPLKEYSSVTNNQSPIISNQLNSKSQYPNFKSNLSLRGGTTKQSNNPTLKPPEGRSPFGGQLNPTSLKLRGASNISTVIPSGSASSGGAEESCNRPALNDGVNFSGSTTSLIDNIQKSINLIMSSGLDYEFRTTAVKPLHHPNDFIEIGKMIKGAKKFYIQNFVRSKQISQLMNFVPFTDKELRAALENITPMVELAGVR